MEAKQNDKWNRATEKDIEAYNSIIEYKKKVDDENLERNNNLS
jgi:hypothetical protein